jgi:catechol 2,3-dioxygenase-like lactoylglutathione lyase family enzyme
VQRYDLRRGASINRLDHINIATPDVPTAYDLYCDLGFGLSETIEDLADGTLYAAWMFRKQTVHDMAFTRGTGPMLHHVAFAVPESHNVLGLCDVIGARNEAHWIERGPGRHGVSNAFYLYLRDPDGHRIEIYTTDYFTGDPDHEPIRWDVRDERRRDFWANPIVPTWYQGSVGMLDLDGNPIPVVDQDAKEAAVGGVRAEHPKVIVGADGLGTIVHDE